MWSRTAECLGRPVRRRLGNRLDSIPTIESQGRESPLEFLRNANHNVEWGQDSVNEDPAKIGCRAIAMRVLIIARFDT